jgi:hypothetical protein
MGGVSDDKSRREEHESKEVKLIDYFRWQSLVRLTKRTAFKLFLRFLQTHGYRDYWETFIKSGKSYQLTFLFI